MSDRELTVQDESNGAKAIEITADDLQTNENLEDPQSNNDGGQEGGQEGGQPQPSVDDLQMQVKNAIIEMGLRGEAANPNLSEQVFVVADPKRGPQGASPGAVAVTAPDSVRESEKLLKNIVTLDGGQDNQNANQTDADFQVNRRVISVNTIPQGAKDGRGINHVLRNYALDSNSPNNNKQQLQDGSHSNAQDEEAPAEGGANTGVVPTNNVGGGEEATPTTAGTETAGLAPMDPRINLPGAVDRANTTTPAQTQAIPEQNPQAQPPQSQSQDEELAVAIPVGDDQDDSNPNNELVAAEPALEGFAAIVKNPRFKPVAAVVVLVLILAITIPLAILLPGSKDAILLDGLEEEVAECGTRRLQQGDYRGKLAITEMGIECQDWAAQFPHEHSYTPEAYPDGDLSSNFCRNPCGDCEPRAWCYTKDPNQRWAYCDVKFCGEDPYEFRTDCGHADLGGYDYRGNVSHTASGKKCLPWDHPLQWQNPTNRPSAGLEENYCRNPDSTYPYCLVNDPNNPKEWCDLNQCGSSYMENATFVEAPKDPTAIKECGDPRLRLRDYRGTMSTTEKGNACLPWKDTPENPEDFEKHGLEANYCRNPSANQEDKFTWCYVDTGAGQEKELCNVPVCDDFVPRRFCGTKEKNQDDYRGGLKITASGKDCKWWIVDDAVLEKKTPFDRPWDGLIESYCRNPGEPSEKKEAPWCYIEAKDNQQNWEYCDIPFCKDCGTTSLAMEDYTGTVSKTRSGKTCMPWEDREFLLVKENSTLNIMVEYQGIPLTYQFGIRERHSLEENYCRNPLPYQRETVWCYTDEDGAWEYCDAPECVEPGMVTHTDCGSQTERQADYRGDINVTGSGQACRPWELQDEYTVELYPDAGLEGPYCRQPAGSARLAAWCFVNETEMTWEYCDIPICDER